MTGFLTPHPPSFVGGNITPDQATLWTLVLGLAFRHIYASSSVNVGNGTVSSTLIGNYLSLGSSASTTIIQSGELILGLGTNFNKGVFWVDGSAGGNGGIYTSGTLQVTGLATFNGGISTASATITNIFATNVTTTNMVLITATGTNMNLVGGNLLHTPGNPNYLGGADNGGLQAAVTFVHGRYLFVGNANNTGACDALNNNRAGCELQIYDISTSSPVYVGGVSNGNNDVNNLFISGRYAYMAVDGNGGTCLA